MIDTANTTVFENLQKQNPFDIFDEWFALAKTKESINPNAMTLATVTSKGTPQARTVLLKSWSSAGFVFYTNSESRKGCALQDNAQAALLFYWKLLGRQVLIQGHVHPIGKEESAQYFHSRPFESQLNACVSQQSRPIASITSLKNAVIDKKTECEENDSTMPLPPYWRGYCLMPNYIEFWQEGAFRLHHRIAFTLHNQQQWKGQFLQP